MYYFKSELVANIIVYVIIYMIALWCLIEIFM